MPVKGTANRDALIKWLQTQDETITRAALTKKVGEIWKLDKYSAQKLTSYLIKENSKIFKNIEVLSGPEIRGTAPFREYLRTTNKRDSTVSQLIKDFKKDTGKTISEGNARNIGTEFTKKFNLVHKRKQPPSALEQKAINAYKKLPESTKFAFQTSGASSQGAWRKWLTAQGLGNNDSQQRRFRILLDRAGLYKKAPLQTPAEIAKKQAQRKAGISKTGATTYEADLVNFKRGVLKDLKVPLMKLSGGGERVFLDQSHRLSFKQLKRLGEKYTGSNIGADWIKTNIGAAKKLENQLNPLYDRQYDLWKKAKKLKTIPKNLSQSLNTVNNQIAELVAEKSGGRIQGVQVDPYNLKVGNTPINYKYAADLGVTEGSLSTIKPKSLQDFMFKLNYGEQIKNEAIAAGLINKAPKNFKKLLEARVGCAEGCLVQVAKNEPGKITRALTTLPDKAKSFLGLLGRGGARAAPYAALAAVGAGVEPLVKQFVATDPDTYLTNENQMKGMLLATIEGETPKVDEEILKWQMPALGAATAAGAIPGAGEVYRTRQGLPPNIPGKYAAADRFIGPMPKGVGPVRAALGIKGVLGKALGASFSPLAVAATLPLTVAAQRSGGTDYSDIATDPLNWMGPAFASTGAEMASKGIQNPMLLKALRLGMKPSTLRMVSSRFGMPGLAVSAGLWGYDKWKQRKDDGDY